MPEDLRGVITDPPGDASYPITGFSWVVVNQAQPDAKTAQSLVALLTWMTHTGQQYSQPLSYAPLPEAIVKLDDAQLKKVTVDGKAVLP